jgi:non-heme chloroperoxidase
MDHYAADASAVCEHLNLKNAVHIGHSTGGGEVARYVARYGQPQGRVAKAILVSSVPPLMVKTKNNPGGTPIEVFDSLRTASRQTEPNSMSTSPRVLFTASIVRMPKSLGE